MSTDQITTSGTANFGGITEEPEDAELHHISENAVCNTEEVIEVTEGRRAPSPNKPVMIFAGKLPKRGASLESPYNRAASTLFKTVKVLRDTGASRNFIDSALVKSWDMEITTGETSLRVRLSGRW